jgi:hypothetical protein
MGGCHRNVQPPVFSSSDPHFPSSDSEEMMRTKNIGGASVREKKAAALDTLVKSELTKSRAAEATKMSNLKALRLAKEAEQPDPALENTDEKIKFLPRKPRRARSGS